MMMTSVAETFCIRK